MLSYNFEIDYVIYKGKAAVSYHYELLERHVLFFISTFSNAITHFIFLAHIMLSYSYTSAYFLQSHRLTIVSNCFLSRQEMVQWLEKLNHKKIGVMKRLIGQ